MSDRPPQFTPGPWAVVPEVQAEHRWVVGDAEGGSVASCEPMGPWITTAQADANARLIAAAPELYEALSEMVGLYGICDEIEECAACSKAQAALAKARGQ